MLHKDSDEARRQMAAGTGTTDSELQFMLELVTLFNLFFIEFTVMDFKRKNKSQTDGIVMGIEPGFTRLRVPLATTIPPI